MARKSGIGNGRTSKGEWTDGTTNDRVAPLGGEGEGNEGDQRVAPQRKAGHQKGEDEWERKSVARSDSVGSREAIRKQSALTDRKRNSFGSISPSQREPVMRSAKEEVGRRTLGKES